MRSVLSLVVLVLFGLFLCAQDSAVSGTFRGDVYESDSLGFSYKLPAGYEPSSASTQKLPMGSQYLFFAERHAGNRLSDRMALVAVDAASTYLSLHDFAQKMAKTLAIQPQTVSVHDAQAVRLAGKAFYREDLNEHYDRGVMYKTALWSERRSSFLFWMIVAQSPKELEEAVQSVDEMKFHDNAADANALPNKTIDALPGKRIRVPEAVSKLMITKKGDIGYAPGRSRTKVVVRVIVDAGGTVQDVTVLSGNPQLNFPAIHAVEDYHFRPYIWQGRRVEMETEITLTFEPLSSSSK